MRPGAPPQSRRYVCTGPGEVSSLVTDPPGTPVTPCKIRSFTSIQMVHTHTHFCTGAFTHRRFYTQRLLHTETFYTQTLLHTDTFTQRGFYTQTLLHIDTFTHTLFTQTLLHTDAFTHRGFYTQKLLHTDTFTQRGFYTQTLLHTDTFTHTLYTQTLLTLCTMHLISPFTSEPRKEVKR